LTGGRIANCIPTPYRYTNAIRMYNTRNPQWGNNLDLVVVAVVTVGDIFILYTV